MNELDWAERFSRDVDALLHGHAPDSETTHAPEYRQALDLARTLATANLATESEGRQALRARLLAQAAGSPSPVRGASLEGAAGGWAFWRPALVILSLATTVLILLSMMTLAPAQGTPSPSPAQVATRPSTGQPAFGQPGAAAAAQPALQGTLPVQPAPAPTPQEAATHAMRGSAPASPALTQPRPAVPNPSAFAAVGTVPLRGLLDAPMTFVDTRSTPPETWIATQVPATAGGQ
jgi:hypothetical protein